MKKINIKQGFPGGSAKTGAQVGPKFPPVKAPSPKTKGYGSLTTAGAMPSGKPSGKYSNRGSK